MFQSEKEFVWRLFSSPYTFVSSIHEVAQMGNLHIIIDSGWYPPEQGPRVVTDLVSAQLGRILSTQTYMCDILYLGTLKLLGERLWSKLHHWFRDHVIFFFSYVLLFFDTPLSFYGYAAFMFIKMCVCPELEVHILCVLQLLLLLGFCFLFFCFALFKPVKVYHRLYSSIYFQYQTLLADRFGFVVLLMFFYLQCSSAYSDRENPLLPSH